MRKFVQKGVLLVVPWLFAATAFGANPQSVVLSDPASVGVASLKLNWTETATPETDFQCYKVFRSTSPTLLSSIPALDSWSALAGLLLILALSRQRKMAAAVVLLYLALGASGSGADSYWSSNCLSPKTTVTFTDTGLVGSTTYYYHVLVYDTNGRSVWSNEVSATTLSGWSSLKPMPSGPAEEAFLLSDGKVLAYVYNLGGGESLIYNPGSDQWSKPSQPPAGVLLGPKGCRLVGKADRFIFTSNFMGTTGKENHPETMIYDYATNTWTATGSYNQPRIKYQLACLQDGRALIAGGSTNTGWSTSAEIYDPATGSWTLTGSMNLAKTNHSLAKMPDGRIMALGGYFQVEKERKISGDL